DARIDLQTVVSQIVLPDGRALGFLYNQFGEVAEIDTPFGGSIQYDYNSSLLNLPAGKTPTQEIHAQMNSVNPDRAVTAKRTYVGGVPEGIWAYTYGLQTPSNSTNQKPCTDVVCTDKNNNQLLHQRHFFLNGGTYFIGPDLNGKDGTNYSVWSSG